MIKKGKNVLPCLSLTFPRHISCLESIQDDVIYCVIRNWCILSGRHFSKYYLHLLFFSKRGEVRGVLNSFACLRWILRSLFLNFYPFSNSIFLMSRHCFTWNRGKNMLIICFFERSFIYFLLSFQNENLFGWQILY